MKTKIYFTAHRANCTEMVFNKFNFCSQKYPYINNLLCSCPSTAMTNYGNGTCVCNKPGYAGLRCGIKICERQGKLFCERHSVIKLCDTDEAKYYATPLPKCFCSDDDINYSSYDYDTGVLCNVKEPETISNDNHSSSAVIGNRVVIAVTCVFILMAIALFILIFSARYRRRLQRRTNSRPAPNNEQPPSYLVVVTAVAELNAQNININCEHGFVSMRCPPPDYSTIVTGEEETPPPSYQEVVAAQLDRASSSNNNNT